MKLIFINILILFITSCVSINCNFDEPLNRIAYYAKRYTIYIDIENNEIIEKHKQLDFIVYHNNRDDIIKMEIPAEQDINTGDISSFNTIVYEYSYNKLNNTISGTYHDILGRPRQRYIYYLDENKKINIVEVLNMDNELLITVNLQYNENGKITSRAGIFHNTDRIDKYEYFYNNANQLQNIKMISDNYYFKIDILELDEEGRIIKSINYNYGMNGYSSEPIFYHIEYYEYFNTN